MSTYEKLTELSKLICAEARNVRREHPDIRSMTELCRRHNLRSEDAIFEEAKQRVFRSMKADPLEA